MAFIRRLVLRVLGGLLMAAAVSIAPSKIEAQAVESADDPRTGLWVGGEYSYFVASFPYESNARLTGAGAFADYHLHNRIGIEAESHFLLFNGFYGETESTYLGGLQYRVGKVKNVYPFAQFLTGIGHIHFPFEVGSGNYLVLAPGAGATYHLARRWEVRGEFEYQLWNGSPNYIDEPSHEFRPFGVHAGIAYRFRR